MLLAVSVNWPAFGFIIDYVIPSGVSQASPQDYGLQRRTHGSSLRKPVDVSVCYAIRFLLGIAGPYICM